MLVAVSRAELLTQHHICKGGRWIRLRHASQQPSSWQNHPNTSEGRRQLPRYPLMSLRNQVRSACIQAKNFTPSHVQAYQYHCIPFTNKIHLQNTIWDWKLGNEARIANIPMTGTCKSQELQDFGDGMLHCLEKFPPQATTLPSLRRSTV